MSAASRVNPLTDTPFPAPSTPAVAPQRHPLAVRSLIWAFLFFPVAVWFAVRTLVQIKLSNGRYKGKGFAYAALAISAFIVIGALVSLGESHSSTAASTNAASRTAPRPAPTYTPNPAPAPVAPAPTSSAAPPLPTTPPGANIGTPVDPQVAGFDPEGYFLALTPTEQAHDCAAADWRGLDVPHGWSDAQVGEYARWLFVGGCDSYDPQGTTPAPYTQQGAGTYNATVTDEGNTHFAQDYCFSHATGVLVYTADGTPWFSCVNGLPTSPGG